MKICNYFKGGTDKLSGFVYDTETRKYKSFALKAEKWSDGCGYYKTGVKLPGDIDYFFPTFHVMSLQLEKLKDLGFNEDLTMQLNFGAFTL